MELLTFAHNLRFLREKKGLKQADMYAIIGFKQTTWNGYEKGQSTPSVDNLMKISKYFGVSEADLLHVNLAENNGIEYGKKGALDLSDNMYNENHAPLDVLKEPSTVDYLISGNRKQLHALIDKDQVIAAQNLTISALQQALSLAREQIELLRKSPF